ncbi:D-serine ammonia-lyase [Schleiferilactobacillus harbinensis]|uniref:Probable D-serine dehydratase n=1 Tax=Schleiferilactobacillus harbinensis TaxID=304207 RepID=A0A5P8M591_9LACO|nr:D-serine ammonia-lyase [Schleiferilactobacillus harbinensis]QFR23678.1 D-serine ammonia-lyase [Schleiferilactobacillus harbinensis]
MNIDELAASTPIVADLAAGREVVWANPDYGKAATLRQTRADLFDAAARLDRFAPYFVHAFPETAVSGGILESPVVPLPAMKAAITAREHYDLSGALYLKADNQLPISGSIKSRGGIYQVLKIAEQLAVDAGLITYMDDYAAFDTPAFHDLFSHYGISVASTGNLGLSIGIVAAKLGFKATVHMSHDAKQWKKDLLREKGATVIEHDTDFSSAITAGRLAADQDPTVFFIDDEGSVDLYLGYAVAGIRLQKQLRDAGIPVDDAHPLFVYLPAGVGGSPSGVTFGLKMIFGEAVHAIFAEPTHVPSVVLGMATTLNEQISVYDIGLDGLTEADGLAVGRPSRLAGHEMRTLLDAITTFKDDRVMAYTAELMDTEHIRVEPSATAGFAALHDAQPLLASKYPMANATHLVWATGGMLVPDDEYQRDYTIGEALLTNK